MTLPTIRSQILADSRLSHAFFTREGGVSQGLYASLNGGLGSRDERVAVVENRRRMAVALGVAAEHLLTPFQVHSAECRIVERAFAEADRPRCDALATRTPGLALGVTGADCGVVLFADVEAGVVAAAHAGWQGAVGGILEATLDAMERIGARRARTQAVLGPTIGQASYEVGPEFHRRLLDRRADDADLFRPSGRAEHVLFDLPAYIGRRLRRAGIGTMEDLRLDTYAHEARFFSYRRATHRAEPDYGRQVAAIALAAAPGPTYSAASATGPTP